MSLALNEEELTLFFVGRLLVAVDGVVVCCVLFGFATKKVWVSNYFLTNKPIYIKHLQGMNYSHSIVPGGFEVISYVTLLIPLTLLIIAVAVSLKNSCENG